MVEAKRSRVVEDEDVAADDVERGAPKKKKSNGDTKAGGVNDDGETYWSLAVPNRRVTVSKFKGMLRIDVREFYKKDGVLLPGTKGISLSIEQYNALLQHIPSINEALAKEGISVADPADTTVGGNEPAERASTLSKPTKAQRKKLNIEATSDEDDD